MSWWDTKQLTSFASQALKSAQKKIDKVLDIKEENSQIQLPTVEDLQGEEISRWMLTEDSKLPDSRSNSSSSKPLHTSLPLYSPTSLHSPKPEGSKNFPDESLIQPHKSSSDTLFDSLLISSDDQDNDLVLEKNLTTLEKKTLNQRTRRKIGSAKSAFRKVRNESDKKASESDKNDKPAQLTKSDNISISTEKCVGCAKDFSERSKEERQDLTLETSNSDITTEGAINKDSSKSQVKEISEKNEGEQVKSELISETPTDSDKLEGDKSIKDDEKLLVEKEVDENDGSKRLEMSDVSVDLKMSSCWSEASLGSFNQDDDDGGGCDNGGDGGNNNSGAVNSEVNDSFKKLKVERYLQTNTQEGVDKDDGILSTGRDELGSRDTMLKEDDTDILGDSGSLDECGDEICQRTNNKYNVQERGNNEQTQCIDNHKPSMIKSKLAKELRPHVANSDEERYINACPNAGDEEEEDVMDNDDDNDGNCKNTVSLTGDDDGVYKEDNSNKRKDVSNEVDDSAVSEKDTTKIQNFSSQPLRTSTPTTTTTMHEEESVCSNLQTSDTLLATNTTTKQGGYTKVEMMETSEKGADTLTSTEPAFEVHTTTSPPTPPPTPPPTVTSTVSPTTTTPSSTALTPQSSSSSPLPQPLYTQLPPTTPTTASFSESTTTTITTSLFSSLSSSVTAAALSSSSSSSSASTTLPLHTSEGCLIDSYKASSDDDSTPTLTNSTAESKDSAIWRGEGIRTASFTINSMENSAETADVLKGVGEDGDDDVHDNDAGDDDNAAGDDDDDNDAAGVDDDDAAIECSGDDKRDEDECKDEGDGGDDDEVGRMRSKEWGGGMGEGRNRVHHTSEQDYHASEHSSGIKDNAKRPDAKTDTTTTVGEAHKTPTSSPHNSEHTSADEIDTTTSSDIEIISQMSTPSFLGNQYRQGYGACHADKTHSSASSNGVSSPSNQATHGAHNANKSKEDGHTRSDSGSSGKGGEDFVNVDFVRGGYVEVCHRKRSHHDDSSQMAQLARENDGLMRKLSEVLEVLEVRERKVLELTRENVDLKEDKCILKSQLSQLEDVLRTEKDDVEEISKEFSQRIADSESKFQQACREKELLKKALQEVELRRRTDNASYDKVIQEKEETISELLAEGEKLSKQQLQSNNLLKKLRSKEKEADNNIKSLKQKTEEQKVKICHFEGVISGLIDSDRQQLETLSQLNVLCESNQKTIFDLKNELEDAQAKAISFKAALDNSYKEVSALQKRRMTEAGEAQRVAMSEEAVEKLEQEVLHEKEKSKMVEMQLLAQLEELRMSMARVEVDEMRRESSLKQEITQLQKRLQESEDKNQELSESVSSATRPLLRQIDTLQTAYNTQSSNAERVERSLTDKLAEAQGELGVLVERERRAVCKYNEVVAGMGEFEYQISSLRREKEKLQGEFEGLTKKMTTLEQQNFLTMSQKDSLIKSLENEICALKKEKLVLEARVESEERRCGLLQQQLNEKDTLLRLNSGRTSQPGDQAFQLEATVDSTMLDESLHSNRSSFTFSNLEPSTPPHTTIPSSTPTIHSSTTTPSITPIPSSTPSSTPTSLDTIIPFRSFQRTHKRQSVYDSSRGMVGTSLVENLQSLLKMRDSEINHLQNSIEDLERTRDNLSDHVVTLTLKNEQVQGRLSELEEMKQEYEDVNGRYNALLQMYGEKEEQLQELSMDLQEFKLIYKQQMNEVLNCKSQNIPN